MMSLNLQKIIIPEGVNYIGVNAFFDNNELEVVDVRTPKPINIHDCIFTDTKCPEYGILYIPKGSKQAYEKTDVWKDFGEIIEGNSPVELFPEVIVENLKYRIKGSKASLVGYINNPIDIRIPQEINYEGNTYPITSIGEHAFDGCFSLKSVEMCENIETIGYAAFSSTGLEDIKLSPRITIIPDRCFEGTFALNGIDLNSIKTIGYWAFVYSGIKDIFIPSETKPQWAVSCFYSNERLNEYKVSENNPYFKSINGILYNMSMGYLRLEAVPGLYHGDIRIAEGTEEIMTGAISRLSNDVGKVVLPTSVKVIEGSSIFLNIGLHHIELPPKAYYYDYAIDNNEKLEALTISARPDIKTELWINESPSLGHIYLNTKDKIDLNGIFTNVSNNLSVYTASINPHISCPANYMVYVPGATSEKYSSVHSFITEMWDYSLDKTHGIIRVAPLVDGITINNITINGKVYNSREDAIYEYDAKENELEVIVEFNLHNRQNMKTIYDPEFNKSLASSNINMGIEEILTGSNMPIDVYDIRGVKIRRVWHVNDMNDLPRGVYILKHGISVSKYIIR